MLVRYCYVSFVCLCVCVPLISYFRCFFSLVCVLMVACFFVFALLCAMCLYAGRESVICLLSCVCFLVFVFVLFSVLVCACVCYSMFLLVCL